MPINPDAVTEEFGEPVEFSWTSKDALLYAVGVGAGSIDPNGVELEFTTENSDGITQKALAAGVPVCVVPFGRDQFEVARHVEMARAVVSLKAKALTPRRLREAVRVARSRRAGAERIARAFQAAGGATRGAEEIEALLGSLPVATVPGNVATA